MTSPIRGVPAPVASPPHTGRAAATRRPVPDIKPAIRRAIRDLVHKGLEIEDAAAANNLRPSTLRLALEKPSVLALLNAEADVLKASVRPGAIHRIATLSKSAVSEAVKLKANMVLADDGKRNDGNTQVVNVHVAQPPGYVLAIDPRFAHAITGPQPDGLRTNADKPLIELTPSPPPRSTGGRQGGG